MKLMTFKKYSLMIAMGAMTLFACNDEQNTISVQDDELTGDINDDVELETSFEEVDDLALAGAEYDFDAGGKSDTDDRFACADVTKEEIDGGEQITIDFGEGCTGPNGKVKAGTIQVTKIGNHWVPGSSLTVELIDFSIDSVQLEGVRSLTNISEDIESNPTFSILLEGGKATWPDGTFATREVEKVRTLYRADNPLGDEIHVTGVANGVTRDEEAYDMLILEDIVFLRMCRGGKKFVPVSGTKQITVGDKVSVIDFGDGECDNIATKTVDGVTEEITIQPRRRFRK